MNEEMRNNDLYKEFEAYLQSKFGDHPVHEIQEATDHFYIRFVILLNDIYDQERQRKMKSRREVMEQLNKYKDELKKTEE